MLWRNAETNAYLLQEAMLSNCWIDQVRRDNDNIPPADLWRRSIMRGHSGVTLWSLPTMH